VVIGPSGSGKSTLLRCLNGLEDINSGEIVINGVHLDHNPKNRWAIRTEVGMVFQAFNLFPHMTVRQNINLAQELVRKKTKSEADRDTMALLARVGLTDKANVHPARLSGGQQQRVAIARALACSPEALLFDEPTAGVDVENQAVIDGIIQDLRDEKGISIIFSTHKRLEAARLAQEKVFLFEGKLTGRCGENLFSGTLIRRDGRSVCILAGKLELNVAANWSEPASRGPARVFIKPEGIRIVPLDQAEKASSHDLFPGRVLQMAAEGEDIRILVDIGVTVRTLLSRQEVKQSGIMAGDRVRVAIAPDAIVQAR